MADPRSSIPSMMDGLNPGQRQIICCYLKLHPSTIIRVSDLYFPVYKMFNYIYYAKESPAIIAIRMAQDFVGSNNINLLQSEKQTGTRFVGGKDHISPIFIPMFLSPITRCLFPKDDDILLDYVNGDGQIMEPKSYWPVIPLSLVNGNGLGTGSSIPKYNPIDVVANLKRLLKGEPLQPMHPWYKRFKGTIEKTDEAGAIYTVSGCIEEVNRTTVRITELPIGRWTADYEDFLRSIMIGGKKSKKRFIKGYMDHSGVTTVCIDVMMSKENLLLAKKEGLLKKFELTTTISTSNMHLLNSEGEAKKYDNPEQILEDFFYARLELYKKRQKVLLEKLKLDTLKLDNKVRLIREYLEGKIRLSYRDLDDFSNEMRAKEFARLPNEIRVEEVIAGAADTLETEARSGEAPQAGNYDYLEIPKKLLNNGGVQELLRDKEQLCGELAALKNQTPESLWNKDLNALDAQLKRKLKAEKKRKRPSKNAEESKDASQDDEDDSSTDSVLKEGSDHESKSEEEEENEEVKPKVQVTSAAGNEKAKPEPSIDELSTVLLNILEEVDLKTATVYGILRQLGAYFHMDLMHRKFVVKEMIAAFMEMMTDDDDDGEEDTAEDGEGDGEYDNIWQCGNF